MSKRGIAIVAVAAALGGLLTVGAAATHAAGGRMLGHGFGDRERIFRAVMDAKLDIVAERCNLTADQTTKIRKIRDDVIDEFKANRDQRRQARDQFLTEFRSGSLDQARLQQLWEQREGDRDDMRNRVMQAIVDVHKLLTPEQRGKLCDLVEERWGRLERE